jgi:hypothetical protein
MVKGELVALLVMLMLPLALPVAVGEKVVVRLADWPAVNVAPAATPFAVNPVPETVTFDTVTLEFPLFVSVTFNELLLFTVTLPKLKLVGFAPSKYVALAPVPLRGITRGEFGALLTREIEPLALPALVGAKSTLRVALFPAAIVVGTVRPLMLKPVPDALACEIVVLALPLFDRVIVCELLLPMTTFPKLTLDGIAESCGWMPVPARTIVAGDPGALLTIEMLPFALPAAVGLNWMARVRFCEGERVTGALPPVIE